MFRRLEVTAGAPAPRSVVITVDGEPLSCHDTDSVAAALFVAGIAACRETTVSGVQRGPYCMMGVCYDCLVSIDGNENQQACMTRVSAGMAVHRQIGARGVNV
jgi:predicted molibdopterin-dependent oxidoreductase YjgC